MSSRSRSAVLLRIALFLAAGLGPLSEPASAIPAFARRYELPCHFCHDGFPKLSVLGEQFKERGYRLEEEASGVSEWLRSLPVSFRGSVRQGFEERGEARTVGSVKLVSAGSLGGRLSYWIDETYVADEEAVRRRGTDNAFARVEIFPGELYLRGGRMELDVPFTQVRSPNLFPYEVYFASAGFETDNLGTYHDGVEVGGFLDEPTRWSIAVVEGRASPGQTRLSGEVDAFEPNVFARLTRRSGEGRIGAYLYRGRNTLARASPGPGGEPPGTLTWKSTPFRFGLDASIYVTGRLHAFGTVLYGRDSNPFADAERPGGTGDATSFTGGFGQVEAPIRDALVLYGRLDWVHGPPPGTIDPSRTFVSLYPGLRLWLHPRVRLAVEIGFRNQARPTRGAFLVELVL